MKDKDDNSDFLRTAAFVALGFAAGFLLAVGTPKQKGSTEDIDNMSDEEFMELAAEAQPVKMPDLYNVIPFRPRRIS